jgi:hypothetical protein
MVESSSQDEIPNGSQETKPSPNSPAMLVNRARSELEILTGFKTDSVTRFEQISKGWRIAITAVELHRIPASTDVLAEYEVISDGNGFIINYHRIKRYFRNQIEDQE